MVDLGQNINGWAAAVATSGRPAPTITLTHGECLDAATATSPPSTSARPCRSCREPLPAGQVDDVVSAGVPGDVFEPRRTTHGFRYVRIEGHPDDLTAGRRPRRRRAHRHAPHRLVRLQRRADQPAARGRGLEPARTTPATSRPTARTASGPAGPATGSCSCPTAAFLYDVAGFSTKWLRDVAADQWPDGTVANISPSRAR